MDQTQICAVLNPPIVFEDSEVSLRKFQICFCVSWNPNRCAVYLQTSDLELWFFIKLVHFVGDDEAYRLTQLLRNRVLADNTPTYADNETVVWPIIRLPTQSVTCSGR